MVNKQPFPHVSKNNPEIKKLADDPKTAQRWCVSYQGKLVSPRLLTLPADPEDTSTLGSYRDCRAAISLIGELDAIVCFVGNEPCVFPLADPADDLKASEPQSASSDAVEGNSDATEGKPCNADGGNDEK